MDRNQQRRRKVEQWLREYGFEYRQIEHPPLPTAEAAIAYWKDEDCTFCKNLFFRDHKGKQHYLAICEHSRELDIHGLEKRISRGKMSLASEWRMEKYLDLSPGSVSIFGLINDEENHVILLIDKPLMEAECLGFHPNDNRASLMIKGSDFIRFLKLCRNPYEVMALTE